MPRYRRAPVLLFYQMAMQNALAVWNKDSTKISSIMNKGRIMKIPLFLRDRKPYFTLSDRASVDIMRSVID